ncbi:MAG: peptidylprolyl isomerase [Lactobacillus sp.]|nr:peptidylprolyl isomerase [Lactobacillus sp.]MDN6043479.1 peptidylprolyl isomerase [Lactobacillus sp.]MDN6052300.1 peptidylprolyl isomerase [Lactobacillus sp.]
MSYPQLDLAKASVQVVMQTNHGDITLALFPKLAPKTVENFVGLAKKSYYDGVIFHRVISDFMIQGGDPDGNGTGGTSLWGKPFADEFSNQLFNLRGALSMANAGPNTNGSQFFIVQNKNVPKRILSQMKHVGYPEAIIEAYRQGGTPWLDGHHTVFGQVTTGLEVVDEIAKVKRDAMDKPLDDVVINTITVTEA